MGQTGNTANQQHGGLWKFLRSRYLAACVKHPTLRKVRFLRWRRLRKKYLAAASRTAVNPQSVVFECFGGRQYTCSPKAIYLRMLEDPRFEGWSFYWSFRGGQIPAFEAEPTLARATLVARGSDAYYRAFAGSKYWIQNNRVPEYVVPNAEQVYVQCWHGTPLKRLGCDVPESSTGGALNSAAELAQRFKMDSAKWSYLLSPSDYTSEHLADAFGLPASRRDAVILQEGYPRNDVIRRTLDAPDAKERVDAIRGHLNEWLGSGHELPAGKKVLLYAPTFRDDSYTPGVGYSLELPLDLGLVRAAVGDEWVVLLRMHYYVANHIDLSAYEGFAFDVSSWPDINELYLVSDALCTDYSSVFFDYANTDRPLFFLWPDYEHYAKELHGFYLDPETLPGPKCRSSEEFVAAFERIGSWFKEYGKDYEEFRRAFCPKDDGHAAERVIERVFFDAR